MTLSDASPYIAVAGSLVTGIISGLVSYNKASKDNAISNALVKADLGDMKLRVTAVELKQGKIEQMASDMAAMRTDISWIKGIISVGGHAANSSNQ
jgi:hypothetical protein